MEHIYAVETVEQFHSYQDFVSHIKPDLDRYLAYLTSEFQVTSLPRTIVWASPKVATELISDIPIPAYTNDYRIVITPELNAWTDIYQEQLHGIPEDVSCEIRDYYRCALNRNHVLQILGHELAHHSDLFIDEVYESGQGIWFEEGMVEYISRRHFLTPVEFHQEKHINQLLVTFYEDQIRCHSLQNFGKATYRKDLASIFYEYWRSFLAVSQIIENYGGNIAAVFQSYHNWYNTRSEQTLEQWFSISRK